MSNRSLKTVLNEDTMENINASEFITGQKTGVFAYLSSAADTTITTAATYYPILGTFTNAPIESFSGGSVYAPSIKYDGTLTQYFEIDWQTSVKADNATTTVKLGIKKNGVLVSSSIMSTLCKNAGEEYALSGTCVVSIATDDEIQLVITSDGNGDVITVVHYTTTITEFFD